MQIGFTGTQRGLTQKQKDELTSYAVNLPPGTFHHGDCIGADEQAARIFYSYGWNLELHPPTNPVKRAFLNRELYHTEHEPLPYLNRNHKIVESCEILIACPKGMNEELRSGTWATIRYARGLGKEIIIFYPEHNQR